MRVALITDGIWPYVLGGMQKHSYYLCKYLAQNKVYVDLFHFNQSEYDISRLEVFTEKERKFITSHVLQMPRSLRFPGHYLFNSYRYSRAVFERIKHRIPQFDFIFTKGFAGWYLIEQKYRGRVQAPPIAVKFHGYEMFQKPPDVRTKLQHLLILRRPVRSISQKADLVFSYGGKITEIIQGLPIPADKIIEMPSGVEETVLAREIKPAESRLKVLYLGRYERRKGIEELNKAIRQILAQKKKPDVLFGFIGPIPPAKQLKNKNVVYYGEIRNKQKLQDLLRQHDVLICPSWSEGMPNVILEAMAAGLAVAATNVGATNVVVNDQTGWLMPDSSPGTIFSTLQEMLNSSAEQIDRKKKNALLHISSGFTWEKLIRLLIEKLPK